MSEEVGVSSTPFREPDPFIVPGSEERGDVTVDVGDVDGG